MTQPRSSFLPLTLSPSSQEPRFSHNLETAASVKMAALLQPPKRTPAGFYLALNVPILAPELRWASGEWAPPSPTDTAWFSWAAEQRATLLGELLSHGNWFSRPPRHDILDPLFSPWLSRTKQDGFAFTCKTPVAPGAAGRARWTLDGLLMSSTEISPVWSLSEVHHDEVLDQISLFGDDEVPTDTETETREIQIDDIATASPAETGPTVVRSREWESRKFLCKERVREARLKAQIAEHFAAKEEARYYAQFGELDDGESRFSDYDLSDAEGSDNEAEEDDGVAGGMIQHV